MRKGHLLCNQGRWCNFGTFGCLSLKIFKTRVGIVKQRVGTKCWRWRKEELSNFILTAFCLGKAWSYKVIITSWEKPEHNFTIFKWKLVIFQEKYMQKKKWLEVISYFKTDWLVQMICEEISFYIVTSNINVHASDLSVMAITTHSCTC